MFVFDILCKLACEAESSLSSTDMMPEAFYGLSDRNKWLVYHCMTPYSQDLYRLVHVGPNDPESMHAWLWYV